MSIIFDLVYLDRELGELGRLPDGSIVNISGTPGPYFTVGGRPLMFADGTITGPGPGGIVLQTVYDNSPTAQINLSTGKDFIFRALNGNEIIIDAATGKLLVQGDLEVLGSSVVIEGVVQNTDQINVRMPNATTTGITVRPSAGVTPTVDVFQVAISDVGAPVFRIDSTGITHLTSLTVSGTINGIDIVALASAVSTHLGLSPTPPRHSAVQISADTTGLTQVTGDDVQEVIESIDTRLNLLTVGNVVGYEHVQTIPALVWTIAHGANSRRIQTTIWDEIDSSILPDAIVIIDNNTVEIAFNTPQAGRAVLMIF
jgi:hypothetical protein